MEAFRYGLEEENLVLYDRRVPSFTDLRPGSEHFLIVTLPCCRGVEAFCRAAREKSLARDAFLSGEDSRDLRNH